MPPACVKQPAGEFLVPGRHRGVLLEAADAAFHGVGTRSGVGGRLLEALIASTEAADVWTINAGIFPENEASLALHSRHGFRMVGRQERVGKTAAGVWRDVLLLERHSAIVD